MRRNDKRARRTSCFGWAPNLSSVRSLFGSMNNIAILSFLMEIPYVIGDTLFSSKNPANPNITMQNVLACCNGQEKNITELLKTLCNIFKIENLGQFGHVFAGLPLVENFGNTTSGASACRLYSDQYEPQNPCVEAVLNRNVTSGLPDQCEATRHYMMIILLIFLGLGAVAAGGLVVVHQFSKKNKTPGESSALIKANKTANPKATHVELESVVNRP